MAGVTASTQLRASAARLRAAGATGVKTAMVRQLRSAATPVVEGIQAEAKDALPKAGGLNEYMANQKPKVQVRTTGRQAGVSVRSKVKGNYSNSGQWRHPVFSSDRKRWAKSAQSYPAARDWWSRGAQRGSLPAQVAMRAVLTEVAAEIMEMGI